MKDKVSVVDDIQINREILADMLEEDYDVVQAEGGMKALKILKEQHEDFVVVLLDLIMPEVDGFTVLEVESQTETLRKQYRLLQLQAEKIRESNTKIIDILGNVVEQRNLESAAYSIQSCWNASGMSGKNTRHWHQNAYNLEKFWT